MDSQEGGSEEMSESLKEEYEWQPFDHLKSEGEEFWMEEDRHELTNENAREVHLKRRGERKFKKCSKADRLKFKAYAVPLKMPSLIPKPLFKPSKQLIEKKRRILMSQLSQQRTLRYREDSVGKVAPVNSPQLYYKTASSFKFPSQSIHTLQTAELKNTTLEAAGKDMSDPLLQRNKLTSSCKINKNVMRNVASRNSAANKHVDSANKNVDSVNKHVDSANRNVDSANRNVDSVNEHVDSVNKHVDSANKNVDSANKNVDHMTSKYLERGIHFKHEIGAHQISPIRVSVTQASFITLSEKRVEVKPAKVKLRVFPSNSLMKKSLRIFVFNSQDTYIRRILQDNGWVLNPSLSSQHYHLKWNYLPNLADYSLKQGQFYNHMKNSHQLTSKAYLSKNLRVVRQDYYPKCYDIGRKEEKEEFVGEFVREFMMGLLNQIYHYARSRRLMEVGEYEQFYRSILVDGQYDQSGKGQSVYTAEGFRSISLEDYKHYQEDFTLHANLLITAMRYWRRIRKKHDIDYQSHPHFLSFHPKEFQDQQWQIQKYRKNIHGCKGTTGFEKEFYSTPSLIAVERIVKEWVYFSQSNLYGDRNIWIIKPSNSSRGNGITLESDLSAILASSKGIQSKLIQRYIEKPLLLMGASFKKFDIRQWVLLKSLEPLQIYMFSHFYVRICSEEYQLTEISNLKRHLTNYSFNKLHFKSGEDSVMNIDEFERLLLREHKVSYRDSILPKIKHIIIESIKACRENMDDVDGKCFELLGYDILIDEKLKPWLLEVNMSPACEERTDWLKEYLQAMGTGLLHIVLPSKYISRSSEGQERISIQDEGKEVPIKDEVKEIDTEMGNFEQQWQLICLEHYHFNKRDVDQTLEVIGTSLDWSKYQLFERFMDREEISPKESSFQEVLESEGKTIILQVGQVEQVSEGEQVGQVEQVSEVGQVGQAGQVSEVRQVGQVEQVSEVGQVGQVGQVSEVRQVGQVSYPQYTSEMEIEQAELQVNVDKGATHENAFQVISLQRAIRAYLLHRKKRADCGCGLLFHFSYLHKDGCRARLQSQRKISTKLGRK